MGLAEDFQYLANPAAGFEAWRDKQHDNEESYIFLEAEEEKTRFIAALIEWENNVEEPLQAKIDFKGTHTWDEITKLIEKAKEGYEDPKSAWGSIRKCFRKVTKAAGQTQPVLDGWLGLLPSQTPYGSAAAGMNKARDDIFQVLEDIPQQIQRAERAVKAQRTEQLKAIAVELYVKILETLGYVLQWYKENLPAKIFKSTLEQSEYGQRLKSKRKDISRLVDGIEKEVSMRMAERVEEISEKLDYAGEMDRKYREEALRKDPNIRRTLKTLYEGQLRYAPAVEPLFLGQVITQEQLRSKLYIQAEVPGEEPQSSIDLDRAVWFMLSSKFREWLTTTRSQSMLVNGHSKRLRTSPISSNCIRLLKRLEPLVSIFTIYYFYDLDEGIYNPTAMLQTLVGQLLSYYEGFNLNFVQPEVLHDLSNIDTLGRMFRKLVRQLPKTAVLFCVIDGSVFYDGEERQHHVCDAVLQVLRVQRSVGAIMKVLVTSQMKKKYKEFLDEEEDTFENEDILHLPEHADDSKRFDALQWDLTAGHVLEELLLQMRKSRRRGP